MDKAENINLTGLTCTDLTDEERRVSPETVQALLPYIPEWSIIEMGESAIGREYTFDSFEKAIEFVSRVAAVAEAENHHPDIDIRYNNVRLGLTTHDEGGLTLADFIVAAKIDTLV